MIDIDKLQPVGFWMRNVCTEEVHKAICFLAMRSSRDIRSPRLTGVR